MKALRWKLAAAASGVASCLLAAASFVFPNLWSTPDQRADRLFRAGRFDEAASLYGDPVRRGVAHYRAGDFKKAAGEFATIATPESAYDGGTALVMLGKYDDAIKSFDRALSLRPGWTDALDNRAVAVARRDKLRFKGGDASGGEVEADSIVFEKNRKKGAGEKADSAGEDSVSDEQLRGLWLQRVQTRPADFLRARFAWQAQNPSEKSK